MCGAYYSGNEALNGVLSDASLEFSELVSALVSISKEAASILLEFYIESSELAINRKEDSSPVTAADLASHELISDALRNLTPDIPVLSEESVAGELSDRLAWPVCWMIDPLDGTREFIEQTDEFTINIALIVRGNAELGAITVPMQDNIYIGVPEWCARRYMLSSGEASNILTTRRLDPKKPVEILTSQRHSREKVKELIKVLAPLASGAQRRDMGSALKFCDLVSGRADVYPRTSPCYEWDLAAGDALVRAAGGKVTTYSGSKILYNRKETLIAPQFIAAGDGSVDYLSTLNA